MEHQKGTTYSKVSWDYLSVLLITDFLTNCLVSALRIHKDVG
jgi:hypothetical protein